MPDRNTRDRHLALAGVVDRKGDTSSDCSQAMLLTTTAETTYPTVASAFYACRSTLIDGDEHEGGAATYSADGDQLVYALNVGTAVPPAGTRVIGHSVGGRMTFRFDG